MKIPPEDTDRLVAICEAAYHTVTGERLQTALLTDELMHRVVGDHPDPDGLADDIGPVAIIKTARAELEDISEAERRETQKRARVRLQFALAQAAKAGYGLYRRGVLDLEAITVDWVAGVAGAFVITGGARIDGDE